MFSSEEAIENNCIKFPVSCLACGSDCTDKANAYVAYKLGLAAQENIPAWKRWLGLKPKHQEFDELDRRDLKAGYKNKEATAG